MNRYTCCGLGLLLFSTLVSSCKKEIPADAVSASSLQYLNAGGGDKMERVERTPDGGFIFCGHTVEDKGNKQAFLMKVDRNGRKEWYRTYGGPMLERFNHAVQCADGGYVAVGYTSMTDVPSYQMDYVVKTDARGNVEWSRSFTEGTYSLCALSNVQQAADGTIYATGYYPSPVIYMDVMIISFKPDGSQSDFRQIAPSPVHKPYLLQDVYWSGGMDLDIDPDGNLLIAAELSTSTAAIPSLLSVNPSTGKVNYYYPYPSAPIGTGYGGQFGALKVISDNNGSYLMYYRDSMTSGGNRQMVGLMRLDKEGVPQWRKSYNGLGSAMAFDLLKTTDGNLLLAGCTSSHPVNYAFPETFYNTRLMAMRLDAQGNVLASGIQGAEIHASMLRGLNTTDGIMAAGFTSLHNSVYHRMFTVRLNNELTIQP